MKKKFEKIGRRIWLAAFLALFMSMVLPLGPGSLNVHAADSNSGTCGKNLTWSFEKSTGVLTISGTGKMTDWVETQTINIETGYSYTIVAKMEAAPWNSLRTKIKSVVIEEGVTSIGGGAFGMGETYGPEPSELNKCPNLKSVSIPDSVTSIGGYAFCGCEKLADITLPKNLTTIGDYAFWECAGLKKITIPSGVNYIGEYAFGSCTGLSSVKLSSGVTSIGSASFWDCTSLKSIAVPKSVTSIGDMGIGYVGVTSQYGKGSEVKAGFTISGYSGTAAETYATQNGITFKTSGSGSTAKPSKPVISSVTNTAKGITVKWNAVSNADGYSVYRDGKKIKTITGGTTVSYTDSSVKSKNGVTYTYTVKASNGKKTSNASKGAKIVRLTGSRITGLANGSSGEITVKWKKNPGVTGYQVQYSTDSKFKNSRTVTIKKSTAKKVSISKLTENKTYYVRVRSYKTVSGKKYYSAWCTKKSVKI